MPLYIAVVGPSGAGIDPAVAAAAVRVGTLIAEAGAILVCGGGTGTMEAACRGAQEGGGLTVGILPGRSRKEANRWVSVALPTGMGEARNALVVRAADAVIAVGGGVGTLSEIALALKMGRPVVGLGTWDARLPAFGSGAAGSGAAGSGAAGSGAAGAGSEAPGERLPVHAASSPEEAVAVALTLAADPRR